MNFMLGITFNRKLCADNKKGGHLAALANEAYVRLMLLRRAPPSEDVGIPAQACITRDGQAGGGGRSLRRLHRGGICPGACFHKVHSCCRRRVTHHVSNYKRTIHSAVLAG